MKDSHEITVERSRARVEGEKRRKTGSCWAARAGICGSGHGAPGDEPVRDKAQESAGPNETEGGGEKLGLRTFREDDEGKRCVGVREGVWWTEVERRGRWISNGR